jgi:hypothetical protein
MFSEQRTMARNQFTKLFWADSQLVRNGILVRHVRTVIAHSFARKASRVLQSNHCVDFFPCFCWPCSAFGFVSPLAVHFCGNMQAGSTHSSRLARKEGERAQLAVGFAHLDLCSNRVARLCSS